jgi:hypothetical protein
MRMCAKTSLITNGRDVSDGGTFSLRSLSFLSNNGPFDHSLLNGLKIDNDGKWIKDVLTFKI